MQTLQRIALPYFSDSSVIFKLLADEDWPIWLDSGQNFSGHHKDIIAVNPIKKLIFDPEGETKGRNHSVQYANSAEDCLNIAEKELKINQHDQTHGPGWFGFLSYDLFDSFEKIVKLKNHSLLPNIALGFYAYTITTNHKTKESYIHYLDEATEQAQETAHKIESLIKPQGNMKPCFSITTPFAPTTSKKEYATQFNKIKEYINSGDCYQVNLTQQFAATCDGNALEAFTTLRTQHSSPMSAYFKTPWFEVISMSPERFIKKDADQLSTHPIKGTRPRSQDSNKDRLLINELKNSEKDLAENVMIVDLLRNDLGRVCLSGSVTADRLFEIESFPNVHHLVSSVSGAIDSSHSLHDIFKATFPGGSITGAPKVRAMEIIEELEQHRRSIYCGSIVHLSGNGDIDSNIAIRTLLRKGNQLYCWGGGGIVADSICDKEYQETLDKVGRLMGILESEFGSQ